MGSTPICSRFSSTEGGQEKVTISSLVITSTAARTRSSASCCSFATKSSFQRTSSSCVATMKTQASTVYTVSTTNVLFLSFRQTQVQSQNLEVFSWCLQRHASSCTDWWENTLYAWRTIAQSQWTSRCYEYQTPNRSTRVRASLRLTLVRSKPGRSRVGCKRAGC